MKRHIDISLKPISNCYINGVKTMSKQKYPCPDCKMGLFPLYKQVKNSEGKRTFQTTNMYWCANCNCYINGEMIK